MKTLDQTRAKPSPTPRRAKARPALLAAGLKLLAERPVDSLSIDEIVEAAHVAKGSFFYHFVDKQSFAREIARNVREELERQVAEVNRGVDDPALRVARGVCQFVLFATQEPDKAAIMAASDWRAFDPGHALNAGLRADLDLGLSTGRFDCPDRDAAMLSLIAAANLLIRKIVVDRLSTAQARPLFQSVMVFAYRGLGLAAAAPLIDAVAGGLLGD